jgi:predicted DNA-binding transcriptional regulator AlpA
MELDRSADYHIDSKSSISPTLVGWLGGSINTFTISALERATGVPRSTIHFYITEELLPKPAKTAASRSLYTDKHVELLQRITRLKQSGLSLSEIKEELQEDRRAAG